MGKHFNKQDIFTLHNNIKYVFALLSAMHSNLIATVESTRLLIILQCYMHLQLYSFKWHDW
jgi:hypothetical protein